MRELPLKCAYNDVLLTVCELGSIGDFALIQAVQLPDGSGVVWQRDDLAESPQEVFE
jgi:hypothetical protein